MLKPTTRRAGSGGCRARPRAVEPPSRFILAEDAWQCVWRTMVCSVGSDRWQMSKLDGDAAGSGAAFGHDVSTSVPPAPPAVAAALRTAAFTACQRTK